MLTRALLIATTLAGLSLTAALLCPDEAAELPAMTPPAEAALPPSPSALAPPEQPLRRVEAPAPASPPAVAEDEAAAAAPPAEDAPPEDAPAAPEAAPARRIEGRVIDAYGAPIGGATITLWCLVAARDSPLGVLLKPRGETRSAPDGRFELEPGASLPSDLRVRAEGFCEASVSAMSASGPLTITLELRPCVVGRVVDAAGAPVSGAFVTVTRVELEADAQARLLEKFVAPAAQSGSDGRFELRGLEAGEVELRATFEGRAAAPVKVTLAPGATALCELVLGG